MNTSLHRVRKYTIFGLLLWFVAALIAGWLNLLNLPGEPPIGVGLFFVLPIVFFVTLYAANEKFFAFANSISLTWIVGAHIWRFVGIGFVVAVLLGRLPAGFGIPEGIGDVIAAAFAIPLALALRRNKPVRGHFVAWNIFGLADLLSALTVGVLYSEGPFGLLRADVSTAAMVTFPVSVIPTFFVPLFVLLHILALLRRNEVGAALDSRFRIAEGTSMSL